MNGLAEDQTQQGKATRAALREELDAYTERTLLPAFGTYTEDVFLPAITASEERLEGKITASEERLTEQIGKLRTDLIDFVDRKIESAKAEIIAMIRAERKRERLFNIRLVEMLEAHKVGSQEELHALKQLIVAAEDPI